MSPVPRNNPMLLGHEAVEQSLLEAIAANRLPHGMILAGEAGIGKATLAYRLTRYLLAAPNERTAGSLAVDPASPVAHRVAASSHGDLITVERDRDPDSGKPSKEVAVEDVRKIAPFLRMTAAEGGWRVAIIDETDALNRAGQNALLKILEEPPPRTVLMLVCNRPGMLLPTIHSRCRLVRMASLPARTIVTLLESYTPDLSAQERQGIAALADGSVGKALQLIEHDGLTIYAEIIALIGRLPRPDWQEIHAFADRLSAPAAEPAYRLFTEFLPGWVARLIRVAATGSGEIVVEEEARIRERLLGLGTLDRWIAACEKISHRFAATDFANLDRKLAVWAAFQAMEDAVT